MPGAHYTAKKSEHEEWYPYVVLVTSLYLMVVGSGSIYMLVAALKPIAAEFQWPRSVPSMAYALQFIGGGVGGIIMGHWLDRAGMAKPACMGAVMIGSGSILSSGIDQAWQLYAIYGLMMGLAGRAALFSPLMVNITHWFERRRGMAVGIVGGGQALAGATWPRIFQEGIASVGWRDTVMMYGVFVLVTMVPLSTVFLRERPGAKRQGATDAAGAFPPRFAMSTRSVTALLCLAIVGCCVAMSLPLAHLLSHASDIGFTPTHGAQLLSVMLVCATFTSMVGLSALSARLGSLGGLMVFSGVQALTLGLFPLADTLPELYVVAALFGFGYGGVLPSYPIVIREHTTHVGAGARTGLVVFFGTLGMALGSGLGGISFDLTGAYSPAFYVGVVFNFGNLAILAYLIRRIRGARYAQITGPLVTAGA